MLRHLLGKGIAALVLVGFMAFAGEARACQSFARVDNAQVMALMAQVKDPKVPELERGLALETLVCDDRPYVREQATRDALSAASSPMLRSIVLTHIIHDLKSVNLELQDSPQLNEPSKNFLRETKGIVPLRFDRRFPDIGCVNVNSDYNISKECTDDQRILIRGTKINLKNGRGDGVLELTDGGELIGYYRPRSDASPIPARINLF